jgi:GNAT superfamily N-acetyltransferase
VRPLRHSILRPDEPVSAVVYEGDEAPDSAHFGCLCRGVLVGVASVIRQASPGTVDPDAWCLRGVATREAVRGRGYGTAVLAAVLEHVAWHGGGLLWCNSRLEAAGFYAGLGFADSGGPSVPEWWDTHRLMSRPVGAGRALATTSAA